jgi:thiol-disulfide isomerase/thioredoxin
MRLLLSLALLQLNIFAFGQNRVKTATIDFDSLMKPRLSEILGKAFPTFVAANEKRKISNDSLMGKVVLINFWFEGCPPCIAEFNAFNELAQKLKGNKNFEFISFTKDNTETIKRVKEKYNLQYEVFQASTKECYRLNKNSGFPTNFILDKQGTIKYWNMGGDNDPARAREFVMTTLLPKIQQEL